jgi:putative transposase
MLRHLPYPEVMGRPLRVNLGGYVYHVLNRANARLPLFRKDADYEAFERILTEAHERLRVPLLAYCLMPSHWHLVLWPQQDGHLSRFMNWLTLTHTQRWHAERHNAGTGHLYQGRYKSFVVERDEHFLTVCRYVEGNALRAGLVQQADDWRWSSLWRRRHGDAAAKTLLGAWPMAVPQAWVRKVNRPQTEAELAVLRRCVLRGQPYGNQAWVEETAARLDLQSTLRPRGRPRKAPVAAKKGS